MNKKLNTLLFVLGATLFNVIVTAICFLILLIPFVIFPQLSVHLSWAFTMIFLGAIVLSIIIYRIVLKILLKKIDLDKYFDPMFAKKYKKK